MKIWTGFTGFIRIYKIEANPDESGESGLFPEEKR
jgi:hypothetical protein